MLASPEARKVASAAPDDPGRRERLIRGIPVLGVCGYFIGFAVPGLFNTALIALALCALVVAFASAGPADSPRNQRLVWAIGCFLLASGVSAVTGMRPGSAMLSSLSFVPAILLFFLVGYGYSSLRQIEATFITLAVAAIVLACALAVIGAAHPLLAPPEWVRHLDSLVILVPNDVAFLAVLTPVFIALVVANPWRIGRSVGVVALLATVVAGALLESRTAVLTMLVCLIASAVLLRSRRLMLACFSLPVVVMALDAMLHAHLMTKFVDRLLDTRLALWWTSWRMFLDAPILGHGPVGFAALHPHYLARSDLPPWLPVEAHLVPWSHSLYLELMAERGMLGLFTFAAVVVISARLAWRRWRLGNSEQRLVAATVLASLAGMGFAAAIELTLLRHWVVAVLFLLFGVSAFLERYRGEKRSHIGEKHHVGP
jgi:O-antigen ligase